MDDTIDYLTQLLPKTTVKISLLKNEIDTHHYTTIEEYNILVDEYKYQLRLETYILEVLALKYRVDHNTVPANHMALLDELRRKLKKGVD